ncbi:MAG TPA: hypothetical protein VN612_12360 [Acidobacteriaceae bacterium]|nr:hypothetical protein [Acidobacteriaceae bacterium]
MLDAENMIDQTADRDTVSTPEGDNESPPDQPVLPAENIVIPNGNAPSPYNEDKPSDTKETVDKLSVGQILA